MLAWQDRVEVSGIRRQKHRDILHVKGFNECSITREEILSGEIMGQEAKKRKSCISY